MQDSYSSKYNVSINSMLCSSENLGVVYDIKDNGITKDIKYILLYSLDNHKLVTIAHAVKVEFSLTPEKMNEIP